jgi:hypothetical protein
LEWQWIAARASGFTAYGLVTIAVVLGLLLSQRWQSRRVWPRLLNDQLHQYAVLLAGIFTAIHGLSVWIDPFTKFTLREVLLPFVSHYRPLWMGLGIVAGYLGFALVATSWLRPKIGFAWWRRLHYLAFVVWLLATLHGLGDGSDSRTTWAIAIYGVSSATVVGLTIVRLLRPAGARGKRFTGWAALAAVVALAGVAFAATGPMRSGWNAIANGGNGSGSRLASTSVLATSLPSGYQADFSGTVNEIGPNAQGSVTLQFNLQVASGPYGQMALVLQGTPLQSGGVEITASSLSLGTAAQPNLYQGSLTQLNGGNFGATLQGGSTGPLTVTGRLTVLGGNQVQGVLQVQPGAPQSQPGVGSGDDGGGGGGDGGSGF